MNTLPSWADPWPEYPHNQEQDDLEPECTHFDCTCRDECEAE